MLYRSSNTIINPSNSIRQDHISNMFKSYEKAGIRRNDASIKVAAYDITLYKQLIVGLPCTCNYDTHVDLLDEDGNLASEVINNLSKSVMRNFEHDRVVGITEYSSRIKQEKFIDSENFTKETLEEFIEDDDDTDEPDIDKEVDLLHDGAGVLSAFGSNCPICSRTGIVGGFSLYNATRIIRATQHFTNFIRCSIDTTKSPFELVCLDDNMEASVDFQTVLPKSATRIQSCRVLNGFNEVYHKLYLVDNDEIVINESNLLNYCDGRKHNFRLKFYSRITHMDIQIKTSNSPLFVDIGNWSRSQSQRSLNDLDPLSVVFPSTVGQIRRGDVFFEKLSGQLWIMTSVEALKSAYNNFGYSGTADRVKSEYEPYSLYNPYITTAPKITNKLSSTHNTKPL